MRPHIYPIILIKSTVTHVIAETLILLTIFVEETLISVHR